MAFTLAEVLITLGIIGVVAAMTIPTLQNNSQKTQYVTGLKKAYAEFNQALLHMSSDMGCVGDLKCTGLLDYGINSTARSNAFGAEIIKYFSVVKNRIAIAGTVNPPQTGCWPTIMYKNYDKTDSETDPDIVAHYRFVTTSGILYRFQLHINNCSADASSGVTGHLREVCGFVYIDVNGHKLPNTYGRDIFVFYLSNGKGPMLYPAGGPDFITGGYWKDINACTPSNPRGFYCAGRIMDEGWQMNY